MDTRLNPKKGGTSYRPHYSTNPRAPRRRSRSPSPDRSLKRQKGDSWENRRTESGSLYRDYRDRTPDAHTVFANSRPIPQLVEVPKTAASKSPRLHTTRASESSPTNQRENTSTPESNIPSNFNGGTESQRQGKDRSSLSSKIHSLRRQLAKSSSNMPPRIRQEKERELAGYVLDQDKSKTQKLKRKHTNKYHFVRFLERKKAERILKDLLKQREALLKDGTANEGDADDLEILKTIQKTEVDIAYTIYTPLSAKYISLFADNVENRKISGMKKRDQRLLSDQQRRQLLEQRDETLNILRNQSGLKPPGWYVVEELLSKGDSEGLERLRDSGVGGGVGVGRQVTLAKVGGRHTEEHSSAAGSAKRTAWMDDDGIIDPEDLDSESESDGGVDLDMQDGDTFDGGFFET